MLKNVSDLFVNYTFVAMSQILLQTNKTTRVDDESFHPVYYILQWEKGARWRNSDKQCYSMLRSELDGFFVHEHALKIIGQKTVSDERNLY